MRIRGWCNAPLVLLLAGILAVNSVSMGSAIAAFRPDDPEKTLLRLPTDYSSLFSANPVSKRLQNPFGEDREFSPNIILDKAEKLIKLGQHHNEPRFMSRAATLIAGLQGHSPYLASAQPESSTNIEENPRYLLLKASLLQHKHQFTEALELLTLALKQQPANFQARLMRAQIYLTTANYDAARADCQTLVLTTDPVVASLCLSQVNGITQQESTVEPLLRLLSTPLGDHLQQELHLTIALTAERRLQNKLADVHYQQALTVAPERHFARLKYADFLLNQQRFRQVITLLNVDLQDGDNHGKTDLMLRLRLAYQHLHHHTSGHNQLSQLEREANNKLKQALKERFASMSATTKIHDKDYALYLLVLQNQPQEALSVAKANWKRQKEPTDALLLLQAATSAGNDSARQTIARWYYQNNIVDERIAALVGEGEDSEGVALR